MSIFDEIIALSKKLAASILGNEKPTGLEESNLFDQEDKDHILKSLTDETDIKNRQKLLRQIDKRKDWKFIKNKTQTPVRRLVYWKYAVAASIALLLAGTFYFIRNNPTQHDTTTTVVTNNIKKGTDKATLTLEDGSNIVLEKGQNYSSASIKSNGEELVYSSGSPSKEEIAYNYLTIPRGGQFFIKLSDGTQVWLNSESQLKYPVMFSIGKTREVELVYGEAYFDVSPSSEHDGAGFKVIHSSQEIEVLGTEFNIKAYSDEDTIYTTLVEGKVSVYAQRSDRILQPGEQSKFDEQSHTLEVSKVDVYNEVSWKDGIFSFEGKPLKDIMRVLSRWYDMDVDFANKDLEQIRFVGILGKDQNIEDILTEIQNIGFINSYEINDKTVTLK